MEREESHNGIRTYRHDGPYLSISSIVLSYLPHEGTDGFSCGDLPSRWFLDGKALKGDAFPMAWSEEAGGWGDG